MIQYNIDEINKVIQSRRTIKPGKYSDKQIDSKIIDIILENANWAPSHGNSEPWRFVVFTGNSRALLADFKSKWYKENTPPEYFKEAKFLKYSSIPFLAPYIIAICMKREPDSKIPEIEDIQAVACAVQNMQLTAVAYGIGTYWNSGGFTYSKEVINFLGFQLDVKCLGFLYLGYPLNDEWPKGYRRTDIIQKTIWKR